MSAIDPFGTCHLVGCPGKGKHAPHVIGAPTEQSWADAAADYAPPSVIVPVELLQRVDNWLATAKRCRYLPDLAADVLAEFDRTADDVRTLMAVRRG